MQTADIAKSTECWCERIWADDLACSAPLLLKWFFFQHPLPLIPLRFPLRSRSTDMLCLQVDVKAQVVNYRNLFEGLLKVTGSVNW